MTMLFINGFDDGFAVVVQENFIEGEAFCTHDGGTYLAEAYAMSPTGAVERESLGYAFGIGGVLVDYEGRTVEVRIGQGTPYLEFLAYGKGFEGTYNLEATYAAAAATQHWC